MSERHLRSPLRKAIAHIFSLLVFLIGGLIGIWMGIGRGLFGAGGELIPWYLWTMTPIFIVCQVMLSWRLFIAIERDYPIRPRTVVFIVLSWLLGIAFGLFVPDIVDGEIVSAFSKLVDPAGQDATLIEFALGFSNPLGIVAIGIAIVALIIAWIDSVGKKLPNRNPYAKTPEAPQSPTTI